MSDIALQQIAPHLDAANVDLKSFKETFYRRRCKARLTPVLDNIRLMKKFGIWVEVTTLLIPGENDSIDELTNIAQFIAQVDSHMPWHVSAFRPEYKLTDKIATPLTSLEQAYRVGKKCGLKFIYLGNVTSDEGSTTFCPNCAKPLIKRMGFLVSANQIKDGKCGFCNAEIKGVWR
jgi:pyruvate formate lyase activating enzyme